MKLALIGAAAVAAAAFATPALARADAGYYVYSQNGNAVILDHTAASDAYRYHGGPKAND
ncbi:hypothetical protein [Bradyrhizobium lablabi]|uniref:DUF680 domain-containing protein n=3 Tax=Nitrobacteraceae TaxID=41294 RepID=A0ABY0Q0D8_9BRAD|nr:hypothetical protein [Bradyrhizobium lablabi]SDJ28824.1 hypothetical protein SAMN05444163_5039 [Bradyrhizobium ottawaense]SEC72856.1 hypothetical protein SAMN05444171_2124 [Bradyrhizobium lablabi]SHK86104.1 hypothetical protein SAMN05444321_0950 [Bradyrhizobium lablabi]